MKRDCVMTPGPVLSGAHWFVSRYRAQPFPSIAGTWSAGSPSRHFHQTVCGSSSNRQVGQISPDKNVNFRDATAAFTPLLEPWASYMKCRLTRKLGLVCYFCSSAHHFALRLPSDGPSRFRPCLRLVLVQMCKTHLQGSRTGDFHPISSRPCRAYTFAGADAQKGGRGSAGR